jgi:hypothetical protein
MEKRVTHPDTPRTTAPAMEGGALTAEQARSFRLMEDEIDAALLHVESLQADTAALRTRLARTEQLLATARRVVSKLIVRGIAKDTETAALCDRLARAEARERELREALEMFLSEWGVAPYSPIAVGISDKVALRARAALAAPTDGAAKET